MNKEISILNILFSFNGRINRKIYNLFFLASIIFSLILNWEFGEDAGEILSLIILAWPGLAVQIKRWHDIDKSGWWTFISLVPIANIIYLVILMIRKGTDGSNQFGEDPLLGHVAIDLNK